VRTVFRRRTQTMPLPPAPTKHHPSSVDLELVKQLAARSTSKNMTAFLSNEFSCISKEHAGACRATVQADVCCWLEPLRACTCTAQRV
jgi:DNA topoisomerase VI subunit B